MAKAKAKAKTVKSPVTKAKAGALVSASSLGIEQVVESDLLIIPRIKLVQRMSEEIEDFKYLSLINSATKELISEAVPKEGATITIIPIMIYRSRLLFKDLDDGGGILCRADDGLTGVGDPGGICKKCPMSVGGENVDGEWEPPACTDFINVSCIIRGLDSPLPFVLSFSKTSSKYGKQFYNMLVPHISKDIAILNFAYDVQTVNETTDQFNYGVFKVKQGGFSTPEERKTAVEFLKILQETKFSVDDVAGSVKDEEKVFADDE